LHIKVFPCLWSNTAFNLAICSYLIYAKPLSPLMRISIGVDAHPTESTERIKEAVRKIFPETEFKAVEGSMGAIHLEGDAKDLKRFTELLARERIRDTARSFLHSHTSGQRISFSLNKQAAFAGTVNFIEDEDPPLGSIDVVIEHEEPKRLIELITNIPERVITEGQQ